jgi:hypothetical protein
MTRGWCRLALVVPCCAVLAAALACAAAPRQRPVKMGDVDTGAGSVESARRQLQGTWDLEQFETVDASGARTPHKAAAVLRYDEYGNLAIEGQLAEPTAAATAASPLIAYKGRAVIDPSRRQLRVVVEEGDATSLPAGVSTTLVREYTIDGDRMTLVMIDTAGRPTASTTWKRRGQ